MKPISIAVVGAGHLGKIHTRLLRGLDGFQVAAVVDSNPDVRLAIEKEFQVATLDDYRSLNEQVEAVVIATPTNLHLESALWCLENGKHCLVEKPLVRSSRQATMLVQIAERRSRTLQVGHVERFNPAWQAVRAELEHPVYLESHRSSTYTGRSTDIGAVLDLMIHDIDLILDAVDSPITEVSACGQSIMGLQEDWAEARLDFENGTVAKLFASRVSRTAQRTMRVVCDHRSVDLDFAKGTAEVVEACDSIVDGSFRADRLHEAERKTLQNDLFTKWLPHRSVSTTPVNAIELELKDFLQSIRESKTPIVDGQAGLRAVEVAEKVLGAMQASSDARRKAREAEQRLDIIPAAHRFGTVRKAS